MFALTASSLITPLQRIDNPLVLIEDGLISKIGSRAGLETPNRAREVDFGDALLLPGLIDIHVHGGAGYDVMQASPDGIASLESLLFQHGVATYFPTTVTAPVDAPLAA